MNIVGTNVDLGGNSASLLQNDATLNFNQTGNSFINSAMSNNDEINVNGGVAIPNQNFTNNGTIDIDAGRFCVLNAKQRRRLYSV